MGEKSELHRDYVLELENELRELEKREESSTRRMQMLVYPAMVAFVILAAYGFFLVHSLTTDVGKMAKSIVVISDAIGENMGVISSSTVSMSNNMNSLVNSTKSMSTSVGDMSSDVGTMSKTMGVLQDSTKSMATSTSNMQQDMWSLNQNISTPLSMFNQFIPWSNNSNGRFRGSSPQRKAPPPPAFYPQPPVQSNVQPIPPQPQAAAR